MESKAVWDEEKQEWIRDDPVNFMDLYIEKIENKINSDIPLTINEYWFFHNYLCSENYVCFKKYLGFIGVDETPKLKRLWDVYWSGYICSDFLWDPKKMM